MVGFLAQAGGGAAGGFRAPVVLGVVLDTADKQGKPPGQHEDGLGFHDLRRTNATGLVASGVDVKTAQGLLGHSDSRLTLDHYAQVVTELSEAAAAAMGVRFMRATPRDERAMDGESGSVEDGPENDTEGL